MPVTNFDSLHALIATRRSIRRWTDEPVPREDLARMVDAARLAPSDTNAQPWHFTVVTDPHLIERLAAATSERFGAMGAELEATGLAQMARKLRVFEKYAAHFGKAPALVLISGEPYDSRFMREVFPAILPPDELAHLSREESVKSTALAAMNLLLAAHALGYGAVPMTGPVMVIPEVMKALLQVQPPFEPHLLIALGRPAAAPPAGVGRKPLDAVSTWL